MTDQSGDKTGGRLMEARTLSRPPVPGNPGKFSSARNFAPGVGSHFQPGSLGGYHIDFTIKTTVPEWPPPWFDPNQSQVHIAFAQWGLGCYERFLAGEGDAWLQAASHAADYLVDEQRQGGPLDGAWLQMDAMPHTYRIDPPWASAMGQGEGASLLVRVHQQLGDDRYAEAALRALRLLDVPVSEGGLRATLGDGLFLEEYPTATPSYVLNGGIFALWGCHDVAIALDDAAARATFDAGAATLAANLHRWDLGNWSRYDLYPFPIVNISSSAYQVLHATQLRAMARIVPDPEFTRVAERFESYTRSPRLRRIAFARKAAFRLVIPRNALLAQRVPWGPRGSLG